MAKRILDLVNATPEDSDNIYGDITDDNGSGNGTPMNNAAFHDMFVFFQMLMEKGGVTPNGLPDDAYTGWQLFQALYQYILYEYFQSPWSYIDTAGQPAFQNSWENGGSPFANARFTNVNIYKVQLGGNIKSGASGTVAFTLPQPPKYEIIMPLTVTDGTHSGMIIIATNGDCRIYYTGGTYVSLDGVVYDLT